MTYTAMKQSYNFMCKYILYLLLIIAKTYNFLQKVKIVVKQFTVKKEVWCHQMFWRNTQMAPPVDGTYIYHLARLLYI